MKKIRPGDRILPEAITYDDILLVPRKSLPSRSTADLTGRLTKKISLKVPIVSSNMDTVTEVEMMNSLAVLGAIGILHRNNSVQDQVSMVIEHKKFLRSNGLQDYPIVASVGVNEGYKDRCGRLIEAGVNALVIDIAHGYSQKLEDTLKFIKETSEVEVITGNISTAESARFVCDLGADGVKVGIGGGSMCQTRVVTGFGVPMISSLETCYMVCSEYDIPIIADGGLRVCGDIVKALWAGADSVMLGGMLSATQESPGELLEIDGKSYKEYRGMASVNARVQNHMDHDKVTAPEGVSTFKPFKGSVVPIIQELVSGLGSAFSYGKATSIEELRDCWARKITPNVNVLNIPHGVVEK
jgi:IMP dehydrogenase